MTMADDKTRRTEAPKVTVKVLTVRDLYTVRLMTRERRRTLKLPTLETMAELLARGRR
jgi:hypothetical protein